MLTTLVYFIVGLLLRSVSSQLQISSHDATLSVRQCDSFYIISNELLQNVSIVFKSTDKNVSHTTVPFQPIPEDNQDFKWEIEYCAYQPGFSIIAANIEPNLFNFTDVFLRVSVQKCPQLEIISEMVGWIYFLAWSVSFYPQLYENYSRKSVVGFNFDFIALNIVGFILYSVFNLGLYFVPELRREYWRRYPTGVIPVKLNDVVFSTHAAFAVFISIIQCFIYERGNQKVTYAAKSILGTYYVILLVSVVLSMTGRLHWLDFIYVCSFIKLSITLIKYIPQAYMNYQRQSTVGWSIGNVLLDFTGGILSMLQMIINGYNYDDWKSIFGDATKFGLGLFSVMFDVFFMYQHYYLYRGLLPSEQLIENAQLPEEEDDSPPSPPSQSQAPVIIRTEINNAISIENYTESEGENSGKNFNKNVVSGLLNYLSDVNRQES